MRKSTNTSASSIATLLLGFLGRRADVRRGEHVVELEQRQRAAGLLLEHVERGAGQVPGLERLVERGLVDDAAAGAVDEVGALLHLGEGGGAEQVLGLGR